MKKNIHDLNHEDLINFMGQELGEPSYRANQILQGLYRHLYTDWSQFSNLEKNLRAVLAEGFSLTTLEVVKKISSKDSLTEKFLFRLMDGLHIETVLLRKDSRRTVCISTQIGCQIGCIFCATGKMGFSRDLSSGEIIEQVLYIKRELLENEEQLSNIVIMGMGEPLMNVTNLILAIKKMTEPDGLNFGARRITLSTIGIIPAMKRLATEKMQINLAVSLHAPTQDLRSKLVPISRYYPLDELISACHNYFSDTGRRITFEYIMIKGVNDTIQHANNLCELLARLNCHVNLIPFNPISEYQGEATLKKAMQDFGRILIAKKIPVSIRENQGAEIQAACGQLAFKQI